ncbi:MAG: hypothetical protein ABSA58_03585 [Acetobacteraceae bacterium]
MEFIYPPRYLCCAAASDPRRIPSPAGSIVCVRRDAVARSYPMLDIAYIVIGAIFLGAFALYALACDRL